VCVCVWGKGAYCQLLVMNTDPPMLEQRYYMLSACELIMIGHS